MYIVLPTYCALPLDRKKNLPLSLWANVGLGGKVVCEIRQTNENYDKL